MTSSCECGIWKVDRDYWEEAMNKADEVEEKAGFTVCTTKAPDIFEAPTTVTRTHCPSCGTSFLTRDTEK